MLVRTASGSNKSTRPTLGRQRYVKVTSDRCRPDVSRQPFHASLVPTTDVFSKNMGDKIFHCKPQLSLYDIK